MFASQISTVLRQAVLTFTNKELFYQNLELLKAALDKTTAEDVNLHPQFMTEELWKREKKAPVTYVDVYEDPNVSIGIFILKPNMKLPLHNHPHMHGLIKVLSGKLRITSYSLNTEKTRELQCSVNGVNKITVEKSGEILVDSKSECCLLEPEVKNLHEIESVGTPAAFLDILAPPYETLIDAGNGCRKCCYYRVLREIAPSIFRLQEIAPPSWYWSDNFPYTGPDL